MGSDNSKDAYPHQQYEYDQQQQQQIAKQQAAHAKTHHHHHHHQQHKHAHHPHSYTQDTIQPKPQPPPQIIQYVAAPTQIITNQPINPQQIQPQTLPQQPIPIQQSPYPTLAKPATVAAIAVAQTQTVQHVMPPTNTVVPVATTAATGVVQQPVQLPQQQQPHTAAIATTAVIAQRHMEYKQPPTVPTQTQTQYVTQPLPQPIPPGYIQVKGADGKQYIVPQGPAGTIPMVVEAQKPQPKVVKAIAKKKKYKTWGVKIVPTSQKAKMKVQHHDYEYTKIVIGIVCDGDKYDGYNRHGGYGAYGHSNYGDLDSKKFVTMRVKVTDQIAIQQNTQKHYLEFWKNGQMYKKVIGLDKNKTFQIRVGSTNHDYDVKLY